MNLNKKAKAILISLLIIRVAMATALIYRFPQKGEHKENFCLGDEEEYFKLAFSLARFNPADSHRTLGFPLLLLPFIWLTGASSFEQLILPAAIFHACILAPVSILLIAFIAKRLTQDSKIALFSAGTWAFFPYLVYAFVHTNPSFCEDVPAMRMAHQMWLQALSDPPSAFLVLLAVWAFLISLEKKGIIYPILTGMCFGLAALVRPSNIGLAVLFLSFYLYKRKLKSLLLFIGSLFFAAIPQIIYNWHFYGSPLKFTTFFAVEKTYAVEMAPLFGSVLPAFSAGNFLLFFRQILLKFPPIFLIFIFTLFLIIIYALAGLYKQRTESAIILTLWLLPYLFIYGSYAYFYKSVLHFLMPAIPAAIILFSIAVKRCLWFL